jgi:hypothetical protein
MSAWKKQAIPLVFLEIAMKSITKENGHMQRIKAIDTRVQRWMKDAWKTINEKRGRIDDAKAMHITVQSAAQIQAKLAAYWDGGVQTVSELPNAMLVIAEDSLRRMPTNNKYRRRAWGYLVTALFDLCKVADPELADSVGQDRGIEIAEMVMEVAA